MMELDIATAQALENKKNGLGGDLRHDIPEEYQHIPEYFPIFDVRRPAQQYVSDKLSETLQEIFAVRAKVEKTLSRNELLAYDKVLISYLQKDVLVPRLKAKAQQDFNELHQAKQTTEMRHEGKNNQEMQALKSNYNEQPEFNRQVVDEDALYKFLAYSAMLEKNRRVDMKKTLKNVELVYGEENFDRFYRNQLMQDAKREPRKYNPEDYLPRKGEKQLPFRNTQQREEDYYKEFELFKENKSMLFV